MFKYFKIKRLLDISISFILLIITSIITIPTSILLSITNKWFPFFTQLRPGKHGKLFKIIKFKTMNDGRDSKGNLLPDKQRLTTVGKIVRKLSIDEIPQLINVLKGDMSLIGPRPLLPEYLGYYTPEQARRHEVYPGITGWAQVNGRNTLNWEEKFKLDVWYVDNMSLRLDFKIFCLTILKIIKREGINSETCATMERFDNQQKTN